MKKITMLLMACAVLLSVSSCGTESDSHDDGAVICVGERSVYSQKITESFERYRGDSLSISIYKDNIVARELFLSHAVDLGILEDPEVQRLIHERSRELLQSEWVSYVLDQVELEDGQVTEFWGNLGTGISYTCFYHEDSLLMDSVLPLVQNGADLAQIAEELAEDEITRRTRGFISVEDKYFSNTIDLEYLISAEAGDIIGPFPIAMGWRILRIDSTWTYTPAPFEVDSQRISAMLLARSREETKKRLESQLKLDNNVQVNPEIIELIASHADPSGRLLQSFTREEEALVVVTWDGGSRDLFSVTGNMLGLPPYFPRSTDNPRWIRDFAIRLALFDLEMQEAIALGLDTVPETANQINSKKWEAVLDRYHELEIAPEMSPDSVYLNEIYLEIRDNFPSPESRVFHVLFLSSSEQLAVVESMMDSEENVLASRDQFEVFPPILAPGEETLTVPLTQAMIPENDRESLFSLEIGQEAILVLSDSTSLWFRLEEINEESIPTLEDIRGRVQTEAVQRIETGRIETLVDSLSDVYDVYIDEEFFRGFYIPLEADSVAGTESSLEVI